MFHDMDKIMFRAYLIYIIMTELEIKVNDSLFNGLLKFCIRSQMLPWHWSKNQILLRIKQT